LLRQKEEEISKAEEAAGKAQAEMGKSERSAIDR